MAGGVLPFDEATAQQLVDAGVLHPDVFDQAKQADAFTPAQSQAPAVDPGEALADEAKNAPVRPEYDNLLKHYQDLGVGGLGGAPDSRAAQSLEELDALKAQDPSKMSQVDLARMHELEATANPGAAQGPVVASNDPALDRQLAASLPGQPGAQVSSSPAGASPEAGHVNPSALATTPSQPQAPQGPDYLKQMQGDMKDQESAIKAAGAAGAQKAAAEAGYLHTMQQEMQRQQVQEAQREQERQNEVNGQMAKLNQMSDELKTAKIDPHHFWADKGTGSKIMAAVAIGLGAIGGAMTGKGDNPALEIINKAIDRDIDAQRANLSQKNANYQTQAGLYSMMRQKFSDDRAASLAARTLYLQQAELNVKEIATRYQGQETAANSQAVLAGLKAAHDQSLMQLQHQLYQQAALRQIAGGGQSSVGGLLALPKEMQEKVVPIAGGARHGIAFSPEAAKEVREVSSAADNVRSIVGEMRKLKEEGPRVLPYGQLQAKAQELQSRLIPALNEMAGLKRLSEEDIKNLQKQVPDPGSWLGDRQDALLNGLEQSIHDRTESYYRNNLMGYKPVPFTPSR
jgi:hypothetical protein